MPRKEFEAGGRGAHLCFCGNCECETQEECVDPETGCPCQQRESACCGKPHTDDPDLLFVAREQHERELIPA